MMENWNNGPAVNKTQTTLEIDWMIVNTTGYWLLTTSLMIG
jgi:hypothetical protein